MYQKFKLEWTFDYSTSVKRLSDNCSSLQKSKKIESKLKKDEGRAYYSMGVLCDNICNFELALKYYNKFLYICKSLNDFHGFIY